MFDINDVVIIRKIGNKSSYEPILNKKGVVVDFVNSYDALTMTTRRKYYVDVCGYKNEYQAQGYYVFEDETWLERAYQDARVLTPDTLDAPEESLLTVEIHNDDTICQVRGFQNRLYNEVEYDFMEEWANAKNLKLGVKRCRNTDCTN